MDVKYSSLCITSKYSTYTQSLSLSHTHPPPRALQHVCCINQLWCGGLSTHVRCINQLWWGGLIFEMLWHVAVVAWVLVGSHNQLVFLPVCHPQSQNRHYLCKQRQLCVWLGYKYQPALAQTHPPQQKQSVSVSRCGAGNKHTCAMGPAQPGGNPPRLRRPLLKHRWPLFLVLSAGTHLKGGFEIHMFVFLR